MGSGSMGGYIGNGSRSNLEVVSNRGVASHAWHDVPYGEIAPEVVNVVVEVPAESKVKYSFDKDSGMLCVDKILASSIVFPHNCGFIPQTLIGDENEPLGVVVLMQKPVQPMTFLQVRSPAARSASRPTCPRHARALWALPTAPTAPLLPALPARPPPAGTGL